MTPAQISANIRQTLATTIPAMSMEIGSPQRKIIDAVATAISQAYMGNYLAGSLFDVDSMTALQLEQFTGIFGIGRLQGRAARGTVQVTLNTPSTQDTTFMLGTQFYTTPGLAGVQQQLYFSSTQAVVLSAGDLTCSIPVQCTIIGTQGNVPPDSVTFTNSIIGGSTVTNLAAMSGGTNTETDQQLRQRFKDTLLRNVAGTSDFYKALCQQNTTVSRAAAYGPTALYQMQIAVPAAGVATPLSVAQDVKYAWDGMTSLFSGMGTTSEVFYSDVSDYTFQGGSTPQITVTAGGALDSASLVGTIVDLEFQYTTQSSRNDPQAGITNKVDLFVDGINAVNVTEQTVVGSMQFSNVSTQPNYVGNFVRVGPYTLPSVGNYFTRLGSVPLVAGAFPSSLTIGGLVYTEGTHYYLVGPNQGRAGNTSVTLLAGSPMEWSGIEWLPPALSQGLSTSTDLTLSYSYNNVPEVLNALISTSKQISTDVLVHQAEYIYIQLCLSVAYTPGYSVSTVNSAIQSRLQVYFASLSFGAPIIVSVVEMYVQQTTGVSSVSLTTSSQNPSAYGINLYADPTDTGTMTSGLMTDFQLGDNQLAGLYGIQITRVATKGNLSDYSPSDISSLPGSTGQT